MVFPYVDMVRTRYDISLFFSQMLGRFFTLFLRHFPRNIPHAHIAVHSYAAVGFWLNPSRSLRELLTTYRFGVPGSLQKHNIQNVFFFHGNTYQVPGMNQEKPSSGPGFARTLSHGKDRVLAIKHNSANEVVAGENYHTIERSIRIHSTKHVSATTTTTTTTTTT